MLVTTRISLPCRLAAAGMILGFVLGSPLPGAVAQEASPQPGVPSWQYGVSTWQGSGYQQPEPPSPAFSVAAVDSGYTMPNTPSNTFGASVPLAPSVAGQTNFVDPPSYLPPRIAQAATQVPLPTPEPWLEAPVVDDMALPTDYPMAAEYPTAPDYAPSSDYSTTPDYPTTSDYPTGSDYPTAPVGPAIANQIGSGVGIEAPPLQEEIIRWYQSPWRWVSDGWDNHAELGIDGSDGNADTLAIQMGLELKRKTDTYILAFDIDRRQASSRNVTTEDNARLNIDYDRLLGDSRWSAFGKFGLEYDDFKAFDVRLNLNSGLGYHWIRSDQTSLITRFGAGASREFGAPVDDWIPEAVLGIDAEHQLNSRNKLIAKADYFPAWEDFSDYRLVSDFAWEILLNDAENFSLKLSVTDRYDSTPQGALANDVYYSAMLLYKF